MNLLSKIIFVVKRLICAAFNLHEWEERTLIQWCVKCLWLQRKDPARGWIFFDDTYDDSWMTPQDQKTISEELFEYLELET